ncbi:MAG: cation-transporting P-type ATPase [Patescibacteria group bacterium]
MTKISGLTSAQANEKLKKYGFNKLNEKAGISLIRLLVNQLKKNYLIYLFVFTSVLSFIVGKNVTGWAILFIVLMVIGTTFIQEYRAEKAISSLKNMILPLSIVIRNGRERRTDSSLIVPGDIVILHSGERIPADGVILHETELRVNESVLTGESKDIAKTDNKDALNNLNKVFMGTFVTSGKATLQITHTGMNTEFGKIAGLISETQKELPLQEKVNKIVQYMATIAIIAGILVGVISLLRNAPITNEVLVETMLIVIAIVISSFPEGFPVVLTSTLASGAYRMAQKNAVVNRMSTIETLGETTVICSDKTGTITMGEMTVGKIITKDHEYNVSGTGFSPDGQITLGEKVQDKESNSVLFELLKCGVVCNDARISKEEADTDFHIAGTPTEASLLFLGEKGNIYQDDFDAERISEIPFSSERKMMAILINEESGKKIYTKGAPEVILKKTTHVLTIHGEIELTKDQKQEFEDKLDSLAKNGFRTLALAYKSTDGNKIEGEEGGLTLIGILGIDDPPRSDVAEAIADANRAGIKVKMITGDSKHTAIAIAQQIGISNSVLSGSDLDGMSDDELRRIIADISIFARVKPEHKLRIVDALKDNGEIVTMTGDGVNDAPALKEAHIGVAMGKNGTDATREVADLTLRDDNFSTIVEAIKEGRTIFDNIQKFVTYQLSCNMAELTLIILAVVLGLPLPLVALQILFMNLITDDLPAISLGFTPSAKNIMRIKPRKQSDVLTKKLITLIVSLGLSAGLVILGVFAFSYKILHLDLDTSRTATLLTLIFIEITAAFSFRSLKQRTKQLPFFANKFLVIASAISFLATLAIVYTPLNAVFNTRPIHFLWWPIFFVLSLPAIWLIDYIKIKKGIIIPIEQK